VRQVAALLLLFAGAFFVWRYTLSRGEKRVVGKWGRRVAAALIVSCTIVFGALIVLSTSSWRFW